MLWRHMSADNRSGRTVKTSNEDLAGTLESLRASLSGLDLADGDGLAEIGAELEGLIGTAIENRSGDLAGRSALIDLIYLAMDGLDALARGVGTDRPACLEAVVAAFEAAEKCLGSTGNPQSGLLDRATDALSLVLSGTAGERGPPLGTATLHDLTALFVSLGPDERAGLEAVRVRLQTFAADAALPGPVRDHSLAAAERIEAVVDRTAPDSEAALADAGVALELAAAALDSSARAEGAASQESREPERSEASGAQLDFATSNTLSVDADPEILADYIVESLDHVSASETALLALEAQPDDAEAINTVFRAFHTVKGTSGFLGLGRIQKLAHLAENLLSRARGGEIRMTGRYADVTLETCDTLKTMIEDLRGVEPGGSLPVPSHLSDLLSRLDLETGGMSATDEKPASRHSLGQILIGEGAVTERAVARALEQQSAGDPRHVGEILVEREGVPPQAIVEALDKQSRAASARPSDDTIRVNMGRLDSLVNMVGELVIADSMVAQDPRAARAYSPELAKKVAQTGKITRELQDLTLALRMVPLKATFDKMRRIVRDLARKFGKQIEFITEGEDTEVDRNMVEAISDPLVHLIRNAADHGLESAAKRRARGKAESGCVTLSAQHSAGSVVLELRDDGEGLDLDRIVRKATERGLVEAGRSLDDDQACALIFQPGFSTAAEVTDVSGRGVGLDVVKRGIESLRGSVAASSEPGVGTTFTLRLPLTMAITDAMLLEVGAERYLLPTVSIQQSLKPEPSSLTSVAGRGEMVLFRGGMVPIVRLHRLFGVVGAVSDPCDGLLTVVDSHGKRYALFADRLLGQQQVVIKSLGRFLGNVPGISGGGILGDGRVGLILDPLGVLNLAEADGAAGPERHPQQRSEIVRV